MTFKSVSIFLIISCLGCATIAEGDRKIVRLHVPDVAATKITLNGREISLQDGNLVLEKSRPSHFLAIERPGYYSQTFFFRRDVDPEWFGKNLVWVVFPIAYIVDYATSAQYRFEPEELHVTMRRIDEGVVNK